MLWYFWLNGERYVWWYYYHPSKKFFFHVTTVWYWMIWLMKMINQNLKFSNQTGLSWVFWLISVQCEPCTALLAMPVSDPSQLCQFGTTHHANSFSFSNFSSSLLAWFCLPLQGIMAKVAGWAPKHLLWWGHTHNAKGYSVNTLYP